jgi:hypothetical protein
MTSAWIITQEGPQHPAEVIGILSARKSGQTIKEYVEWLYALLHYHPGDHLALARYNNPTVVYEAQFMTTNTGVPVDSAMTCGDNPFLVACRAKNIFLIESDDTASILKWTNPDRLVCDEQTPPNIIEKIPGTTSQAPIHLPLRIGSGARRLSRNMAAL